MEEIFKDAKVGDKLYSLRHGEVKVVAFHFYHEYQIMVQDKFADNYTYTTHGYYNTDDATRDLYWTKPDIIENKRIVAVEEDVWINKDYITHMEQSIFRRNNPEFYIKAKLIYQIEK